MIYAVVAFQHALLCHLPKLVAITEPEAVLSTLPVLIR